MKWPYFALFSPPNTFEENTVVSAHLPFTLRFVTDGGEVATDPTDNTNTNVDTLSTGFSVNYMQTSDCDTTFITA